MKYAAVIWAIFLSAQTFAYNEHLFFIRLNIDENRIELGKLGAFPLKQVEVTIPIDEHSDSTLFLQYVTNAQQQSPGSALFFLHCMWGANNGFVRYQFPFFETDFLDDSSAHIGTVFYILWDTKPLGYFENAEHAVRSGALLSRVFQWMQTFSREERDRNILFCHSMGNKVFFSAISGPAVDAPLFGRTIFAAADIDEKTFYTALDDGRIFSYCKQVAVLYNEHDYALRLSKATNAYSPLGLGPHADLSAYPNITTINCADDYAYAQYNPFARDHIYYRRNKEVRAEVITWLCSH